VGEIEAYVARAHDYMNAAVELVKTGFEHPAVDRWRDWCGERPRSPAGCEHRERPVRWSVMFGASNTSAS
jgi:hypothetical protein